MTALQLARGRLSELPALIICGVQSEEQAAAYLDCI
jgi:hypothetical protein